MHFLRRPGAAGVAIAVVSVPLILVLGDAGFLVAFCGLCLYPVLDVPRILPRPSWWRGAVISASVWVVLFVVLVGTANARRPVGEAGLVFVVPLMTYPMALAISGLVRLERRFRGRPRESGQRIAAILITLVCGGFVLVPIVSNMIPILREKITGTTPGNVLYSTDGEVVSAAPERLSVRTAAGRTESFRLDPGTRFGFLGPGWRTPSEPAGPSWLKAGQRVGLEYVYRAGEAEAKRVTIWIERKGCAGDAKWTAALSRESSSTTLSLSGTTWEGWVGSRDQKDQGEYTTFEFLEDNRLAYQDPHGARNTNARWRQNGPMVIIEVNDCYAEYEGQIEGGQIVGEFSNEMGLHEHWTARRKQPGSATTPR